MNNPTAELYGKQHPVVHIKNLFSSSEIDEIMKEISYIQNYKGLNSEEHTGSARNIDSSLRKKNSAFLFSNYSEQELNASAIVNLYNEKIDSFLSSNLNEFHYIFRYMQGYIFSSSLVNFYKDGDFYQPHVDMASFTSVGFFWNEPKKFTGGEFILNDINLKIDYNLGDVVFFPSIMLHEVKPVKIQSKNVEDSRITISTFYVVRSPLDK